MSDRPPAAADPWPGCDVCSQRTRVDRRSAALAFLACRHGPEFLKRCRHCGGLWLETLRYERWLTMAEAEQQFGGSLADGSPPWPEPG